MKSRAFHAVVLLALTSGCTGNSSPPPTVKSIDGVCAHQTNPTHTVRTQGNLAKNSETLRGWMLDGYVLGGGGPGGIANAEYTGTGQANSAEVFSPAIPVVPGRTYVFSAWIDPSHITDNFAIMMVTNAARNAVYGNEIRVSHAACRYADTVTLPGGVKQAVLVFSNGGSTAAKGQKVRFSQPLFHAAEP
jgi:hypothetical protein